MRKQTAVVLLGLMLASSLVLAQPHWRPAPGLEMLDAMAERLGLTESQEASINELIGNSRLAQAEDRERLSQVRAKLHDLSRTSDAFDQAQAQVLADEMAGIAARMAVAGAELRWQVRQVLTEEQRAQADALQPRHHVRLHAPDAEF